MVNNRKFMVCQRAFGTRMYNKASIVVSGVTILISVILFAALAIYISQISESDEMFTSLSESNSFVVTSLSNSLTAEEGITSSSVQRVNDTWLNFDGVNDWVNLGNNSPIGTDGNPFSVTGWVRVSGLNETIHLPNYDLINRYQNHTNGYRAWSFFLSRYNANKPFYWCMYNITSPQCVSSNTLPQNNQWYFITGTYNGSCLSIYVNGTRDNSAEKCGVTSLDNPSINLTIGGEPGTADYTKGYIDDVRIYNVTLTADEILEIYQEGRQ